MFDVMAQMRPGICYLANAVPESLATMHRLKAHQADVSEHRIDQRSPHHGSAVAGDLKTGARDFTVVAYQMLSGGQSDSGIRSAGYYWCR
jgi:hypothetical protein